MYRLDIEIFQDKFAINCYDDFRFLIFTYQDKKVNLKKAIEKAKFIVYLNQSCMKTHARPANIKLFIRKLNARKLSFYVAQQNSSILAEILIKQDKFFDLFNEYTHVSKLILPSSGIAQDIGDFSYDVEKAD